MTPCFVWGENGKVYLSPASEQALDALHMLEPEAAVALYLEWLGIWQHVFPASARGVSWVRQDVGGSIEVKRW